MATNNTDESGESEPNQQICGMQNYKLNDTTMLTEGEKLGHNSMCVHHCKQHLSHNSSDPAALNFSYIQFLTLNIILRTYIR